LGFNLNERQLFVVPLNQNARSTERFKNFLVAQQEGQVGKGRSKTPIKISNQINLKNKKIGEGDVALVSFEFNLII